MTDDIQTRLTTLARAAIQAQFEQQDEDGEVQLFIQHHLDELEASYWLQHTGTATPQAAQVLQMLVLSPHIEWELEDEDDSYVVDFVLPDEVSQYVLCVEFDQDEQLLDICMES